MTIPSWFKKTEYLESKLAQLIASGDTSYTNIVQVDAAIEAAGLTAYEHFTTYGSQERTSPNKYFQADEYLAAKAIQMNGLFGSSGDWTADKVALAIKEAGLTIWDHFQQYGWNEGVNPSNSFDVSSYLDAKLEQLKVSEPDAGWTLDKLKDAFKEAGLSPISHYFEYGQGEFVPVQPVPADEQVPSAGGGSFTLTTGEDNLTGTSGNDTFNAPIVSDAGTPTATLQSFDVLDGGAGSDTLNATLDGTPVAARISNIEVFNFRGTAATAIDLTDVTGVEQIWNSGSVAAGNLTYTAAPITATFGVRNTASTTDIDTFAGLTGTDDVLNLVVSGAGNATTSAVVTSGTDAGAIEGLNVTASGTNFVDLSGFTAVESLTLATTDALELQVDGTAMTDVTITGSGALDLFDAAQFNIVENVVATGFSGDLILDISGSNVLESVATGAGNDDVTVDGDQLTAAADLNIDLGEGDNTLRLANIDDADFDTLVFTGDDLTVAGVGVLAFTDTITLTAADRTLDLDGIAPSAIVFEDDVDLATFELALDNTAASLELTFEGLLDNGDLNLGDAAETVVINAEDVVGGGVVTVMGEALASLTLNLEDDADIDVGLTEEALESVVINATGDTGATTITSTISGDATEEFSLTSLTLADATEDGDTTFDITLVETVNLTTINLSGGEATDITIDAALAEFAGTVTINIGDFGVAADGTLTGGLDYTADTANAFREVFKFGGTNIGNIDITNFLAGVGGNADRLDFSAFDGVDGLDDLNLAVVGTDTVITSDAFEGTITVAGVDLTTDAFNFIF